MHSPQPHPRGAWHNWLTQSVYLRAFISVCCPENWPWVTLNHCICVLGRLLRVCVYLPSPVNLYTDAVRNTIHTVKIKVLQVHGGVNMNHPRKRWCGGWTLGRSDREGSWYWLWPGYIKSNDSIPPVSFTYKQNDVSSTLEGTPCLLFFLLHNQAEKAKLKLIALPQAIYLLSTIRTNHCQGTTDCSAIQLSFILQMPSFLLSLPLWDRVLCSTG